MKRDLSATRRKTVLYSVLLSCLMVGAVGNPYSTIKAGELETQQSKIKITGSVVDSKDEPIIGASIMEEGTTVGTVTDLDGRFEILVSKPNARLLIKYMGYVSQTIALDGKKQISVVMAEDSKVLDDVVVIGYGTQRKGDVTSAISSVKAEDFVQGKIGDAAELVKGKIPGLSVVNSSGDPTATSSIMLRGISTVYGTVQPLVLVDGIEGSLTSVAPENIASIDVLKDASAASIYGTRGANGVIIITTKSGRRDQPVETTYSGYLSVSDWYKTADFMDTNDVIYGKTNFPYQGYDTDWLEAVTRKVGYVQNHSLSFRGGGKSSMYSANATYGNQEGIMRKSDNRYFTGQMDFTQYAMKDILKFNFNILYKNSKSTNNNNTYVYRQALIHNPSSPIYNEDRSYYEEFSRFQYYNPVAIQNEYIGDTRTENIRVTGRVTLEPIKRWQTELMVSSDKTMVTSQNYYTNKFYSQSVGKIDGSASKYSSNQRNEALDLTTRYNFSLNNMHHVSAMAGYSYLFKQFDDFSAGNSNFLSQSYLYNNLGAGTYLNDSDKKASMGSSKNDNTLVGFFGRATYAYDNKYNLLLSIRREGFTAFGEDYKWGSFPSVSAGWTISNEKFLENTDWLSNLKLRVGYGVTGIFPLAAYKSLIMYNVDPYGDHLSKDQTWSQSIKVSHNPNPKLKWETTKEWNFGLDWAVLDSRLSGSFDVYSKTTKDLIYEYNVPVPPNLYNTTLANVGKMRNNGIEMMINAVPVRTNDFEYSTTLTLSHNKNKLISLSNDLYQTANFQETGGLGDPISVPTHCIEEGKGLGDFWGLKSVGVSKNGIVLVEVSDGNGGWVVKEFDQKYNEQTNRQRLGNGLPKVIAGWAHTFRYKEFDLSMQFTGQFGYKILNAQRAFYENNSIAYNRLGTAAKWYGAVDETGAAVIDPTTGNQKQVQLSSSMAQGFWSDHLEKGDFVKLSSLTFGYTMPLSEKMKEYISNARVYVSGQNLFCITSYSGLDPEVSNYFMSPGIDDRDKYPTTRSFTIGLSLTF